MTEHEFGGDYGALCFLGSAVCGIADWEVCYSYQIAAVECVLAMAILQASSYWQMYLWSSSYPTDHWRVDE